MVLPLILVLISWCGREDRCRSRSKDRPDKMWEVYLIPLLFPFVTFLITSSSTILNSRGDKKHPSFTSALSEISLSNRLLCNTWLETFWLNILMIQMIFSGIFHLESAFQVAGCLTVSNAFKKATWLKIIQIGIISNAESYVGGNLRLKNTAFGQRSRWIFG